ncbi:hypothetical protein, partial [Acinetobacter nosocomialis]|uniref:hypothetical protein n=1 Tax=Acinetobacter nosocomialis TaxID=106654 RepID=UPI002FF15CC2
SYPSCHLNSVQMSRVLSFKSLCNKADVNGNYHPPGIFNSNSPSYDPVKINDVHIPIKKPTVFPGGN